MDNTARVHTPISPGSLTIAHALAVLAHEWLVFRVRRIIRIGDHGVKPRMAGVDPDIPLAADENGAPVRHD